MQYAEDFDPVAVAAVGHQIACPYDDEFTCIGSATGATAFWKIRQTGNRYKNTFHLPIGGSFIVSGNVSPKRP